MTEAEPVEHARGDCDHVLQCATKLYAKEIFTRVHAERVAGKGLLRHGGRVWTAGRSHDCGRMLLIDLLREARTRQRDDARVPNGLVEHLCHRLERLFLQPFGDAHHDGRSSAVERGGHARANLPDDVRRGGRNDEFGALDGCCDLTVCGDVLGKVRAVEKDGVHVVAVNGLDDLGFVRPDSDIVALPREQVREGRAPTPCPDHTDLHLRFSVCMAAPATEAVFRAGEQSFDVATVGEHDEAREGDATSQEVWVRRVEETHCYRERNRPNH